MDRAISQFQPETANPGLPQGRMALLFAVMLITAAGNTAMQSVMPSIGTHLGIADVWVSLAYSWSALLWMVMAPFWARRSDQSGRKAMMALGLGAFALSFALCGAALLAGLKGIVGGMTAIILFALARSLYGTFGSAAPPAVQAYVASRTSRAERTKALSLVASSFGLGTALGPALAPLLILPGIGLIGPFAGFTLGALAVLMLLRLQLPDDSPQEGEMALEHGAPHVLPAPADRTRPGRVQAFGEHADSWIGVFPSEVESPSGSGNTTNKGFLESFRFNLNRKDSGGLDATDSDADGENGGGRLRWGDPRIRQWLIAGTLGGQAQSIMLGVIGFLLLDRLGLRHQPDAAAGPIGLVLMCGAIAMLLAQWGLIPMLALGPRQSTVIGMALVVVGTLPVALGQNLHAIAMGFAICSVGFGLFRPGFTSGISLAVSLPEQGQAAGIVAAVNGSAYIVSPAIGVWLYNHSPWMVWALVEALVVIVLLLLARDRRGRDGSAAL